jgi:superfamily II DNA or RNA helicase
MRESVDMGLPSPLSELTFATEYEKGESNVAEEFYLPCMERARAYDRIAGYFSSGVLILAWPALPKFVSRGAHMRVICSLALSERDAEALYEGHASMGDEVLATAIRDEFQRLLNQPSLARPARVLAGLIGSGILDIRIATLLPSATVSERRTFHDKVGLFHDYSKNTVGFRGSMNETYLGLAADGNIESIDVFPSWDTGRDKTRCDRACERFEQLWQGQVSGILIRRVPDVTLAMLKQAADEGRWEICLEELAVEARSALPSLPPAVLPDLKRHQDEALRAWIANGKRGILKHATSAGKTITALAAASQSIRNGLPIVIVVPGVVLLNQWTAEVRTAFPNAQILLCGGGHKEWRGGVLDRFIHTEETRLRPRITIATLPAAASREFLGQLADTPSALLIVDEVHNLGTASGRVFMTQSHPTERLGLSATPERAGDPEGTDVLLNYFSGILLPVYGIGAAIADGILCQYEYHPHQVQLTDDEQKEWHRITRALSRLIAIGLDPNTIPTGSPLSNPRVSRLAVSRARIIRNASGKVALARGVLNELYEVGQKWLVYCEDQAQLSAVRSLLAQAGLPTLEYHSAMRADKPATLRDFEIGGGVLLAIRCLDEGINIPDVTHALILASSKNPRQFIQRRGRVLRKAAGKRVAHLHDAIVVPAASSALGEADRLLLSELGRAIEFGSYARNPQSVTVLERMCIDAGVDFRDVAGLGEEDDDVEE